MRNRVRKGHKEIQSEMLETASRRVAVVLAAASLACPRLPSFASTEEPEAARRLLAACKGRRPSSWSAEERPAIDALVDEVVALRAPWRRELLRGKWRLAYLQPGPDGAGVDRRVPFSGLFDQPWNDNFQVFGANSVVNVGELVGPFLEVRVGGDLSEDDPSDLVAPKRFKADITGGALCLSVGSATGQGKGRRMMAGSGVD